MEREGTGLGSRRPQLFPLLSVIRVETLPLTVPQELTWVSETPCREDNIQYQGQVGGGLGLSPSQEVGHGGWGQRLALLSSLPPPPPPAAVMPGRGGFGMQDAGLQIVH